MKFAAAAMGERRSTAQNVRVAEIRARWQRVHMPTWWGGASEAACGGGGEGGGDDIIVHGGGGGDGQDKPRCVPNETKMVRVLKVGTRMASKAETEAEGPHDDDNQFVVARVIHGGAAKTASAADTIIARFVGSGGAGRASRSGTFGSMASDTAAAACRFMHL